MSSALGSSASSNESPSSGLSSGESEQSSGESGLSSEESGLSSGGSGGSSGDSGQSSGGSGESSGGSGESSGQSGESSGDSGGSSGDSGQSSGESGLSSEESGLSSEESEESSDESEESSESEVSTESEASTQSEVSTESEESSQLTESTESEPQSTSGTNSTGSTASSTNSTPTQTSSTTSESCPCTDEILRDGQAITENKKYVLPGEIIALSFQCQGHSLSNFEWTIPGVRFENYEASLDAAALTELTDFKQSSISFFWVDAAETRTVTLKFKADGIDCTKTVVFHIQKPVCNYSAVQGATQLKTATLVKLSTNQASPLAGMRFTAKVTMPVKPSGLPPYPQGDWQFVQTLVIRSIAKPPNAPALLNIDSKLRGQTICDAAYPYPSAPNESNPPYAADGSVHHTNDSPEYGLVSTDFVKLKTWDYDEFWMYVMFRPSGGKWVPLKLVHWGWKFCVSYGGSPAAWSLHNPDQYVDDPAETINHPVWQKHATSPTVFDRNFPSNTPYCG